MRKDAGLNGDLDWLPQLSWILFLKCFDDLELRREEDAIVARKAYKPVIPAEAVHVDENGDFMQAGGEFRIVHYLDKVDGKWTVYKTDQYRQGAE